MCCSFADFCAAREFYRPSSGLPENSPTTISDSAWELPQVIVCQLFTTRPWHCACIACDCSKQTWRDWETAPQGDFMPKPRNVRDHRPSQRNEREMQARNRAL